MTSWLDLFDGTKGNVKPGIKILSFDGRNVLTDPSW